MNYLIDFKDGLFVRMHNIFGIGNSICDASLSLRVTNLSFNHRRRNEVWEYTRLFRSEFIWLPADVDVVAYMRGKDGMRFRTAANLLGKTGRFGEMAIPPWGWRIDRL
ncbi:MAG: hypothetical protein WCB36_11695 [Burkholderiales bacterium]